MLNLLPQENKSKLINEYRVRFAVTAILFLSALFIIASVGLFPSYLRQRSEQSRLVEHKESLDKKNSEASLKEADSLFSSNLILVDYLEARSKVLKKGMRDSEVIRKILEKRSSSILIKSLDISEKEVLIQGVASTRKDLIGFHEDLRRENYFSNALLPINDIAKSVDADFTIKITFP